MYRQWVSQFVVWGQLTELGGMIKVAYKIL